MLSVIAYHLNSAWMPGGFVGVDIFFVISGFVVAHSVVGKTHGNLRSYIAWFYRRRFLRILPAAYTYIFIASLVGTLFIPTGEGVDTAISLTGIYALLSISNVRLLLSSGDYFTAASAFNTFTHTWSLAVEEQYYFLFPFFSYFLMIKADTASWLRRAMTVVSARSRTGSRGRDLPIWQRS